VALNCWAIAFVVFGAHLMKSFVDSSSGAEHEIHSFPALWIIVSVIEPLKSFSGKSEKLVNISVSISLNIF
tara:strand:+ start:3351 stop:3563 length:213 start_codon:yes stop_codon:yes gene_type:complete